MAADRMAYVGTSLITIHLFFFGVNFPYFPLARFPLVILLIDTGFKNIKGSFAGFFKTG
jgi:hypothetical protein